MTSEDVSGTRNSARENDPRGRRALPQNLHAEQAFIGGILRQNDTYHLVKDLVRPGHLFHILHKCIYAEIRNLLGSNEPAMAATLSPFFQEVNASESVTAIEYLAQLEKAGPSPPAVMNSAHVIYELARRRELIDIGMQLVDEAYDMPVDAYSANLIKWAGLSLSELL